jgi:acyl-CoA thioester hydrolase
MVHMMSAINDSKPHPELRNAYRVERSISTRWSDNDVYGHVNNAVYFHWFDSVLNAFLIDEGLLNLQHPDVIGLMVETHCNYFDSLAYPQPVVIGLRVGHLGNSSVRYELATFGSADTCTAKGHLVHVYVDPQTRKPSELPARWRTLLETLQ